MIVMHTCMHCWYRMMIMIWLLCTFACIVAIGWWLWYDCSAWAWDILVAWWYAHLHDIVESSYSLRWWWWWLWCMCMRCLGGMMIWLYVWMSLLYMCHRKTMLCKQTQHGKIMEISWKFPCALYKFLGIFNDFSINFFEFSKIFNVFP